MIPIRNLAKATLGAEGVARLRQAQVTLRRIRSGRSSASIELPGATLKEFGDADAEVFFGYFDLTPFSADGDRILAMRGVFASRPQPPGTAIAVGYYEMNGRGSGFRELGRTTLWCWQMGCRLRWHPAESRRWILYNRMVGNRYGAVVQDADTGAVVREYPRPFYALSRDGRWALSLNFSRLQRLRPGYGYLVQSDATEGEAAPAADGIARIDLESGAVEPLFSVAEVAACEPTDSMLHAEHYLNHIEVNPSSNRFAFFHAWLRQGKRYTRLLTSDLDGSDMRVLTDGEMVSHYAWDGSQHIVAFATHRGQSGYFRYRDDEEREVSRLGEGVLAGDGHPRMSPAAPWLSIDSYPDRERNQHLMLFDPAHGRLCHLGRFYSPWRFQGEVRCDLHPRWSPDGKYISIDSAHRGRRRLCVIGLPPQDSWS